MNGRLYDPVLGRMLSPDNNVQMPDYSQNFNRYSYCFNNPLKFTDPSGEFVTVIGMLGAAALNVALNGISNAKNGQKFFKGWAASAYMGVWGAGFSNGIGTVASSFSHWAVKGSFQILAHGNLGGLMNLSGGGSYGQGFASGAFSSAASSVMGPVINRIENPALQLGSVTGFGAVSGGIASYIAGGTFHTGFRNGAISAGFNHGLHEVEEMLFPEDPPKISDILWNAAKKVGKGVQWLSDKITGNNDVIGTTSYVSGATGARIGKKFGSYADNISDGWGNVRAKATSKAIKYSKLGKIASGVGNFLTAVGIANTGYMMYTGQIGIGKGCLDIGMGIVGYAGWVGFGISAGYFAVDAFYPGGWQGLFSPVLYPDRFIWDSPVNNPNSNVINNSYR